MNPAEAVGGLLGTFVFLFLAVLGIMWFLLPIFLFSRLSRMQAALDETKQIQSALLYEVQRSRVQQDEPAHYPPTQ